MSSKIIEQPAQQTMHLDPVLNWLRGCANITGAGKTKIVIAGPCVREAMSGRKPNVMDVFLTGGHIEGLESLINQNPAASLWMGELDQPYASVKDFSSALWLRSPTIFRLTLPELRYRRGAMVRLFYVGEQVKDDVELLKSFTWLQDGWAYLMTSTSPTRTYSFMPTLKRFAYHSEAAVRLAHGLSPKLMTTEASLEQAFTLKRELGVDINQGDLTIITERFVNEMKALKAAPNQG